MANASFRSWLLAEVEEVLGRTTPAPPFIVWCDPNREWPELLAAAAPVGGFELWAEPDEHELVIRDRFHQAARAPRIVWLPCARNEITWFKPFELEAEHVWERTLLTALREYGVDIPRDREDGLTSLLPRQTREWFDLPKNTWKELTSISSKEELFGNDRILQVVAGGSDEFKAACDEEFREVFVRRSVEDFGLPDPTDQEPRPWRIAVTARLLATEAAEGCPQEPPSEGEKIIPAGPPRRRSLDLLKSWQNDIRYIPTFEQLVPEAEKTIGLAYWARNLTKPPRSRSSRAVEQTLFSQTADRLDRIEQIDPLAKELAENLQTYMDRERGFWGSQATQTVGWRFLVQLGKVANMLGDHDEVEKKWKTAMEAVEWYSTLGWQLDHAGEQLFKETPDLPPQLHRIRARLRRGYLRTVDRVSRAFSELLAADSSKVFAMPSAGDTLAAELEQQAIPTALVFLDACRLDLGQRLAGMLNAGEPAQRATVSTAVAPVPSITAVGMAFAMPIARNSLQVGLSADGKDFLVTADGIGGNLCVAEQRRQWLKKNLEVKDCLTIDEILDGETLKKASRARRLIAVYGKEFDRHDGELQITGAEEHLQRYVQVIRRLRDYGYGRVIVTTDHGFFHWDPDDHEIEEKPAGEVLWTSRRAIVGRDMTHPHAVRLPVPQSHLEVMVPRSMNSFKTYGGLEFFHGGATLQELIIPVVVANWPSKAKKVPVVLKPVGHIASETPRIQVQAGVVGQKTLFGDSNLLSRRAVVKVRDPGSGKVVFKHVTPVMIEPDGDAQTVQLDIVEPKPDLAYNTPLEVLVLDADDEEILAREEITLKVEINDW
ncbi:PglZ domain-containing protein [Planctomycetota bacterium]